MINNQSDAPSFADDGSDPHNYDILFDKTTWENEDTQNIAESHGLDVLEFLSEAADRWNEHIRLNPELIKIQNQKVVVLEGPNTGKVYNDRDDFLRPCVQRSIFKGIILEIVKNSLLPLGSNILVAVEPTVIQKYEAPSPNNPDINVEYACPIRFKMYVSLEFNATTPLLDSNGIPQIDSDGQVIQVPKLNYQQKLNLLTHVLGHVLSFSNSNIESCQPTNKAIFISQTEEVRCANAIQEYNRIVRQHPKVDKLSNKNDYIIEKPNTTSTNIYLPLEQKDLLLDNGPNLKRFKHWENNFRVISIKGEASKKVFPGMTTEIMTSTAWRLPEQLVHISPVTIKFLRNFGGYIEKKEGEADPILDFGIL